tara:strand:+ start:472 stop:984 length:513 start_codon:yes stop_codon:yes gene_type:complete
MKMSEGMDVHYSSESNEWETPVSFYEKLNLEFNFTLDPCSSEFNYKCEKHYTMKDDGLKQDWSNDVVFMNPPYGREIKYWVKKAYNESLKGAVVVCLIPARTDTSYWHDYIFPYADDIRFVRGRIKFEKTEKVEYREQLNIFGIKEQKPINFEAGLPAPFPSAIVIFKGQ